MDKRTLQKKIAIIGLGYVGLPLALKLSLNFNVVGFDVNSKRIYSLKLGIDTTKEVDEKKLLLIIFTFINVCFFGARHLHSTSLH